MWGSYQRQHRHAIVERRSEGTHRLTTRTVHRDAPSPANGVQAPPTPLALQLFGASGGGSPAKDQVSGTASFLRAATGAIEGTTGAAAKPRHRRPPSLANTDGLPQFVLERRLAVLIESEARRLAAVHAKSHSPSTPAYLRPRRVIPSPGEYRAALAQKALREIPASPQSSRRRTPALRGTPSTPARRLTTGGQPHEQAQSPEELRPSPPHTKKLSRSLGPSPRSSASPHSSRVAFSSD